MAFLSCSLDFDFLHNAEERDSNSRFPTYAMLQNGFLGEFLIPESALFGFQKVFNILGVVIIASVFVYSNCLPVHEFIKLFPALFANSFDYFFFFHFNQLGILLFFIWAMNVWQQNFTKYFSFFVSTDFISASKYSGVFFEIFSTG